MSLPRSTSAAALAALLALGVGRGVAVGQTLAEDQRLAEPTLIADDRFGEAVATDQGRIAVGAPDHDAVGLQSGSVFVYAPDGSGGWQLEDTVQPFGLESNDSFGTALDLEGTRLVVGATRVDVATVDEGAAYVFEQQPDLSWLQVAQVAASDGTPGDQFGAAVALSGSRLAVGAPADDPDGTSSGGTVYVFERQGDGTWLEVQKLVSPAPGNARRFGRRVALSGGLLVVGQSLAAGDAGTDQVFVYRRVGDTWQLEASLAAPDAAAPGAHLFGSDLDLEGQRLLVADPATTAGGRALLYERSGGAWPLVATLAAQAEVSLAPVGSSVALTDGMAVLGGPGSGSIEGRAALFLESTAGGWVQLASIEPNQRSNQPPDEYAACVDLDGATIAIGAPAFPAPGSGARTGSVFALRRGLLMHGRTTVPVAGGVGQDLLLLAGAQNALKFHWILGSASGTQPGVVLTGDVTIPLVVDQYGLYTVANPNKPPLLGSVGLLDPDGVSKRSFLPPPGLDPSFAGLSLHHAYIVFDPFTFGILAASNAVPVTLVP